MVLYTTLVGIERSVNTWLAEMLIRSLLRRLIGTEWLKLMAGRTVETQCLAN